MTHDECIEAARDSGLFSMMVPTRYGDHARQILGQPITNRLV